MRQNKAYRQLRRQRQLRNQRSEVVTVGAQTVQPDNSGICRARRLDFVARQIRHRVTRVKDAKENCASLYPLAMAIKACLLISPSGYTNGQSLSPDPIAAQRGIGSRRALTGTNGPLNIETQKEEEL